MYAPARYGSYIPDRLLTQRTIMQKQSVLSLWCERLIEAGWLLALTFIPIYFNLLSARHFEPDKATTLRAIVLVMLAAGVIRFLEGLNQQPAPIPTAQPEQSSSTMADGHNPLSGAWQRFNRIPLALPVLVYALVFILTTITSVVPLTSFWGSYQRLQGAYTNLSYIGLFVMILTTLRRQEQLERIIIVTLMTSLAVAGYGLLQHTGLDPLPWRGDVITRVASTMGNSIFVAAYMIMVVPLGLYWLIRSASATPSAPPSDNPVNESLWAVAYAILVTGTLGLLLSAILFGAVVQAPDFRYWWVFPGAILVATTLWVLLTLNLPRRERTVPLWPAFLLLGYLLLLGLTYLTSRTVHSINTQNVGGQPWLIVLLLLGSSGAIGTFYALALFLPRQPDQAASQVALWFQAIGALIVTGALLLTIFFTQSRGPWIGLGAGLFVFFFLLLIQARQHVLAQENARLGNILRLALWSWIGTVVVAGTFLIIFNLSDAPFFQRLRDVPYIGRMGRLLEVDSGTGLVRRLIWVGDEYAGGARAMITANPIRTLVGWGPESMFVAFNPFYPPTLATIESRGASPDRSHQAILDELGTKGILGLVSYLFLLTSFFLLAWRLLRQSRTWHWQVFFIGCFSIVVSHFVEGLTGIPIVSSLMMLWVTLGITVTGGMLAGHYSLTATDTQAQMQAAHMTQGEQIPAETRTSRAKKRRAGASASRRTQATSRRSSSNALNPAALAFYSLLLVIMLGLTWWFNINSIYADMRFQQGKSYTEQGAGLDGEIYGMNSYLEAIRNNPREDFYYLNLARSLMSIANDLYVQGKSLGNMTTDVQINDLLRLQDIQQVATFVQSRNPIELLQYAEAVLEHARNLNELNKDHYANLGRLNNFWYNWTQDPTRLQNAADWFKRATEIAPQDVTLLNEYASVTALLGKVAETQGDTATAQDYYEQAEAMLQHSRALDEGFADTDARLADVYRLRGDITRATDLYVETIQQNPHGLDASIDRIIASLREHPEALRRLRDAYMAHAGNDALLLNIAGLLSVRANDMQQALDAYAQAVALQPGNLEYRRNYTIILSNTQQYAQALNEAQTTLELARARNASESEVALLQNLIAFLQQQAAGGQ